MRRDDWGLSLVSVLFRSLHELFFEAFSGRVELHIILPLLDHSDHLVSFLIARLPLLLAIATSKVVKLADTGQRLIPICCRLLL